MEEIEATIKGRVQLVMYRDFVQRKARMLGLVGFVRNNDDGTVSVVAQGDQETFKKFIEYLNKGSFLSKVESVSLVSRTSREPFLDFTIHY